MVVYKNLPLTCILPPVVTLSPADYLCEKFGQDISPELDLKSIDSERFFLKLILKKISMQQQKHENHPECRDNNSLNSDEAEKYAEPDMDSNCMALRARVFF